MTGENPQDTLRRVQADLDDLSRRLSSLAVDFQQLARVLPGLQPGHPQPYRPAHPAPTVFPAPVGPPAYPAPQPQPPPPPPASTAPPLAGDATGAGPRPADPVPVPPRPQRPRRQVSVAEVFSIFGSAITLIGVAFVLVLPQDGVVAPWQRTMIAAVLSVLAVAAALWQHGKDPRNIGAQALMATGVASAFLCIMAVTVIFRGADGRAMLPELPGLALAGLVSLGGVWIARRWNSQWLAVVAILGSLVLAPYIVRENFIWCLAFMVVMTIVSAAFQRGLSWVWLMAARTIPTSLVLAWSMAIGHRSVEENPLAVIGLTALLAAAGLAMALQHQRTSHAERVASVVFMVLMAGPLMMACWRGDIAAGTVAAAAIGAAFAVAGLAERWVADPLRSVAVPLGATFVAFAVLRATDGGHREYIFFGLAAAYLALARSTRFRPVLVVGFVLAAIGVLHWAPLALTPTDVALATGHDVAHVAESLLGLAVTLLGAHALRAFLVGRPSWLSYATWAGAVVFGSVALVLAGTMAGERLGSATAWFQAAHALVTVSWLLLCVVLLRLGLRKDASAMVSVRLAVALAVAAVAKLFLFDLATLPGLVRALAFLAVGVLLLVIGTWYNRQLDRVRRAAPGAAPQEPQTGP